MSDRPPLTPERIASAIEALPGKGWEPCPKCGNMDGGCPFCGHGHIRTLEAETIYALLAERDALRRDRGEWLKLADDVFLRAHVTVRCNHCLTDTEYPPGVPLSNMCPQCRDRELELARDVIHAARLYHRCPDYRSFMALVEAFERYDQRTGDTA